VRFRLTRTWLIGLVAVGATAALGTAIAARGGWPAAVLGTFLVVAGSVGFGRLLVPWSADAAGLLRAGRRLLNWPEVTAVEVYPFRTRRGLGPPHVTVVLTTPDRRARLDIYSRHDAERLQAILAESLPRDAAGRPTLRLIGDSWTAMD
jgi:hypothetical protein